MADDLSVLFLPPPDGQSLEMRYRKGIVLEFDQVTRHNTISIGGAEMEDLPVGLDDVSLLVPGAAVWIVVVGDAAKTMLIAGTITVP
jgi:hypothetical protein